MTVLLFTRAYGIVGVWATMTAELVFRGSVFFVRLMRGRWIRREALS